MAPISAGLSPHPRFASREIEILVSNIGLGCDWIPRPCNLITHDFGPLGVRSSFNAFSRSEGYLVGLLADMNGFGLLSLLCLRLKEHNAFPFQDNLHFTVVSGRSAGPSSCRTTQPPLIPVCSLTLHSSSE